MARYSSERKAALLKKLLPPINMSVAELARQENISEVTLYNWRQHAKDGGSPVPGDNKLTDEWPAEAKFAVVLETAALSEIELSEYCRRKGLYPEQVQQWRQGLAPTPVEPPLPETLVNSVLSISFNTPDCLIVTIGTVCENQDTSVSHLSGQYDGLAD